MKKTFAAVFIFTLLITALAETLFVTEGIANFIPRPEDISVFITVGSPLPANRIYNSTTVPLQFTVDIHVENNRVRYRNISSVQYQVDGYRKGELVGSDGLLGPVSFSFNLTGLSEGRHYVEVTATGSLAGIQKTASSGKIYFTVDTVPPRVQFVSSPEQAFDNNDVSFNFTVIEATSWLGYSLNENSIITITNRVTSTSAFDRYACQLILNDLPDGFHNLTVYAKDLAGNTGASEPFHFTIETTTEQPETEQTASEQPFPTALVIAASGTSVAIIGICLLGYFKKRKQ